jgi:hypothetical protein
MATADLAGSRFRLRIVGPILAGLCAPPNPSYDASEFHRRGVVALVASQLCGVAEGTARTLSWRWRRSSLPRIASSPSGHHRDPPPETNWSSSGVLVCDQRILYRSCSAGFCAGTRVPVVLELDSQPCLSKGKQRRKDHTDETCRTKETQWTIFNLGVAGILIITKNKGKNRWTNKKPYFLYY